MGRSISGKVEEEEEDKKRREALGLEKLSKIKEMYAGGVPFFTKDSIREVHQQLLKAKTGDKVWVLDLDGAKSDFTINIGKVFHEPDSETEDIQTHAHIHYQSLQALLWKTDELDDVDFCTMPIYHRLHTRNKITKEFCGNSTERPDLPREEAEEFFRNSCEEWEASEPCKQLRSILESTKIPVGITKIVAFACSTFSCIFPKPYYSRGGARPATQHALILTLLDILSKKNDGVARNITCYAQDPIYSSLDKEILQQSGIQILDDPVGFLEVDESTVVLSFCPNVCVRQVVCDIARPAMMIWDSIRWNEDEMSEELGRRTDPDSPRLKKMIQDDYDEFKMPDGERTFFATNSANAGIYVRKTGVKGRL
ncbi:hypothetical protein N431DRAFT_561440 [Stipitochalara longipes BDJ]|nr:hypothetical protein N431DRAFT_561440 [Stipitochalara longipes BDJ]